MNTPVARYFDRHAAAFDRRYDAEGLQRLLRPSFLLSRDEALRVAHSLERPRVLDVGCGPGRTAERILETGARDYVGVDLSDEMVALARRRLRRFGDRATIVRGDFMDAALVGPFDLVMAIGLFDYVGDAGAYLPRMRSLCSGVLLATFPRWVPIKGTLRKVVYEWGYGCRLSHYDDAGLADLLLEAGLTAADVTRRRSGYLVTAKVTPGARHGVRFPQTIREAPE